MDAKSPTHLSISTCSLRRIATLMGMGSALYWTALPPLNWGGLGWLALIPWVLLAADPRPLAPGGWRMVWFVSFLLWLGELYFIPIPHWSLWLIWPLFAAYLSIFVPGFLLAVRQSKHRWRVPLWIAVPVAWVGTEWLRAVVITGFPMAYLGHTQYRNPLLIQLADLGGAYLVSGAMALFAALLAEGWRLCRSAGSSFRLRSHAVRATGLRILAAGALLAGVWGYGQARLKSPALQGVPTELVFLLIQGSQDTTFPKTPAELQQVLERQQQEYRTLTIEARREYPQADLVIWPESMFVQPYLVPLDPAELADPRQREWYQRLQSDFPNAYQYAIGVLPAVDEEAAPVTGFLPLLTGAAVWNMPTEENFNSVLLIDEDSEVVERYDKNHRVVFGEYMPLAGWFPILEQWTPVGKGIERGVGPASMDVRGIRLAPSICFESTIPHLIRRHVQELTAAGQEPDYLVNCTNDGWFFGTSCLDLHLACNVFRAVEMRKPMLVAANTGFSAEIDPAGRLLQVGPRRAAGWLAVPVREYRLTSVYRHLGDWPWKLSAALTIWALWTAILRRPR